jgi:hypothetical protein
MTEGEGSTGKERGAGKESGVKDREEGQERRVE